ncbi:bifunctional adenosylcobinamide kinase/adenosylcobinamide-phosphate guanylyltransferase [Chachezhania sediminis]|uniref:bifunctional adenosylcobinamide kinase/adenosylcobinamide-phosphate guanylyltransferase n=1 Tax=Chachezhania sediminis TaxID=2599291 RepID=UPI00131E475E|nr:bifunctional adenosylcobinamide kinase/adenosylcobinamide-phosphate guanylyltransferase [Chachezhania sediminis]
MLPSRTLVIGGAASGKSAYAESLVEAAPRPHLYLATAEAQDAEMSAKIARHVGRRGSGWQTLECPWDTETCLLGLPQGAVALLDCATIWLSNRMMKDIDPQVAVSDLLAAIDGCKARLVVVTNELGHGIVPADALSRRFREAHGRMNIALAKQADAVTLVTAGLPQALKGELP